MRSASLPSRKNNTDQLRRTFTRHVSRPSRYLQCRLYIVLLSRILGPDTFWSSVLHYRSVRAKDFDHVGHIALHVVYVDVAVEGDDRPRFEGLFAVSVELRE